MIVIQIVGGNEVRAGKDLVTIGSDPGSVIAFPKDARVHPQHAVIRQVAGRWLVESQGEGLIRVGNGVPTKMGWLNRGDSIKLSDDGPELVFDPPAGAAVGVAGPAARDEEIAERRPIAPVPSMPERAQREITPDPRQNDRNRPAERRAASSPGLSANHRRLVFLLVAAGLVVAGIALGAFWPSGGRDRKLADESAADRDANDSAGSFENARDPTADRSSRSDAGAGGRVGSGPEAALCLVVVKHPDGGQVFQLGTAFAVAPGRLVTSGAVASGLQGLKDQFRTAWVRSMATKADVEITGIRLHPQYASSVDAARTAQQESDTWRDKISRGEAGDNSEQLVQTLTAIDERVFAAYERQASFDLAMLETSGRVPGALLLAEGSSAPPGAKLSLWGVPFALADYLVDPERGAVPTRTPASVLMRLKPSNDESLARLVIKCQDSLAGQNWSGSPVLNSSGRVIGVYSRPTPPPFDDATDRPAPATHDIVEAGKLHELMADLRVKD
jgi:hypothetical protein